MTQATHDRIFGRPERSGTGRYRKCKVCDGWHRLDQPWPHNCRSEAPRRARNLAAPQLTPAFEAFKAGPFEDDTVIGSRNEKREYMRRHGLTEYDTGVKNEAAQWSRELDEKRECEQLIAELSHSDTDYWTPEMKGDVPDTKSLETGGVDVDVTIADGVSDDAG